jgi:hypothetical protein
MGTEKEYDEIIAPMLAGVAIRCNDLGMNMVARVEWQPGEIGITQIGINEGAGFGQKMAQLACHSKGNLDLFLIECGKRFDLSQTLYKSIIEQLR